MKNKKNKENKKSKKSNPARGGHFVANIAKSMQKINQSIDIDKALYKQDIEQSIAHCEMLAKQKIINQSDKKEIIKGLRQIASEIEKGKFSFSHELEDIHMNIESRLAELIGEAAGRLHTARSRNDQVATDFKLWVRDAYIKLDNKLLFLQQSLIKMAELYHGTIIPGMTHLRSAQPILASHWLLAYFEMIKRDRDRLTQFFISSDYCPLGSAALAGTGFDIDRKYVAKSLGFSNPSTNSLDAVSDRDFALDFLYFTSMLSVHFSRLCEEIIIFSDPQNGFLRLGDKFTTGSSIMPQKRNPDAAELIRGKVGSMIGNLNSLLIVMKSLPLAYNKDLQEDKSPVFRSYEDINLSIDALTGMIENLRIDSEVALKSAASGFSTATDLADFLVRDLDMAFRQAHLIAGKIVRLAEKKSASKNLPQSLDILTLAEMQKIDERISQKIFSVLNVEKSVDSRSSYGGTSPKQVKLQLDNAKKYLKLGALRVKKSPSKTS